MLEKIKEQYNSMTDSQQAIGKYILQNYHLVATLSAAEFAREVGVSDATIVRFAQELGFSGFTEMKNYIKTYMRGNAPHLQFMPANNNPREEHDQILQLIQSEIADLENLFLDYDAASIEEAVEAIFAAKKIYFAALGSSMLVQDFLTLHFNHMGFSTIAVSESNALNFEKLVDISDQDLLIAISFPRYSLNTCKAMQFAKKQGAKIIGITDTKESPIGVNSNVVLTINTSTKTFFNSYVVPMALCNVLLLKIFFHDSQRIQKNINSHIAKLDYIASLD